MDPGTDISTILIQKRDEILSLAERRGARNVGSSDRRHVTKPGQIVTLIF